MTATEHEPEEETGPSGETRKELFLGIDVGSVTIKIALIDEHNNLIKSTWLRNQGSPIDNVKLGIKHMKEELEAEQILDEINIRAVGTTGSARYLTKSIVGGDIAKTEIIAHAVAATSVYPDVRTILEIGGQDSKIIILRDGIVVDFAMNSVCAAGTGSFLDHQASRLGIAIEDFGDYALNATTPVSIAGRCTVFAESDMIHKQQMGYSKEDIIAGLCQSLVRNYLNNVGKGKDIQAPIIFQGGVAANKGIVKAFGEHLKTDITVPEHYLLMGAIGAAILAKEYFTEKGDDYVSNFRGFDVADIDFTTSTFNCGGCPNNCEIVQVKMPSGEIVARWGDRCGRWEII
ncbi:MAG TPA: acyl-CoA dehydratase activase [Candidatus Lokiarchaeia archaeon]|nr:acyl-CoA dehydratase activase [Candidatus Lokiarchaeia archaeon]